MRNNSKKQKYFLFMWSPVDLAVSWLKIEPWSRFLPAIETNPWFLLLSLQKDFSAFFYYVLVARS